MGRWMIAMSWISETLSLMVNDQTDIERWQWQEISKERGWYLTIEGKRFWAREFIDCSLLSECLDNKEVQAEMSLRLQKLIRLFAQGADLQKVNASSGSV